MSTVTYNSVDGISPTGTEILATLEDNTAETLGAPVSELHTNSNAASVTNEANATTGFTEVSLNGTGANVFESQSGTVSGGTYALHANCNDTPTAGARFYVDISAAPFSLVAGQAYTLSLSARHVGVGADWHIVLSDVTDPTGANEYTSIKNLLVTDTTFTTYTIDFVYTTDFKYLTIKENTGSNNGGVYVDELSIKRTNNLVSNGILNDEKAGKNWTLGTGWTISGGVASCDGTQTSDSNINQDLGSLVAGYIYVVAIDITRSAGQFKVTLGVGSATALTSSSGTYYYTLSPGSDNFLYITGDSNFVGTVDNVSVYPAVPDSSTNADGLEIHGEITKAAVNTGSGLMAYSGFSADNYLEQPYSSVFDVSTGAFSFCGWINFNSLAGTQIIFRRGDVSNITSIHTYTTSNNLYFTTRASSTNSEVSSGSNPFAVGRWYFVCATRNSAGTTQNIYIDGVLLVTASVTARDIDVTEPLWIGNSSFDTTSFLKGSACLEKFEATELTATQIKTIYDNEKGQFKANAPFREVNQSYSLVIPLLNSSSLADEDNKYTDETINQTSQTLFYGSKKVWNAQSTAIPLTSASSLDFHDVRSFINSVKRGQTFSFDEYDDGTTESVILKSSNQDYTRDGSLVDYYRINMTLREA